MTSVKMRSVVAGILLAGLFFLPRLGPASRGFSRAELGRLRAGRLVSRPVARSGRNLVGGNSWIVVDAPVAEVWRALASPDRYARIWSNVERVRILSRSASQAVVHIRQRVGLATSEFVLRLDFKERSNEVDFRVNRSGDIRDGWGFFRLEAQGGRTLVAYGAVIDPASGFVRALFEDRLRQRLLGMPTGVKRYVERQYRASRGHSG